ncbi:type II secretion system protein [Candidatus Shapirobacteria bacterium]|nr:type II secretion system protein [Candidatus Shapirobacteria bacterium]
MRHGFTLVELMVVITIGIVITGGAMVSVTKYVAKEKLVQAASEVVSMVDLARNMAIINQVTAGFTNLDYVAVTLTSSGVVSVFPVNNISGVGSSLVTKKIGSGGIVFSSLNLGGLQFAAGSGKLVGKNPSPSYQSYPLPPTTNVGITISSTEVSETQQIIISPFGGVTNTKL